jgi:hypothetical protein
LLARRLPHHQALSVVLSMYHKIDTHANTHTHTHTHTETHTHTHTHRPTNEAPTTPNVVHRARVPRWKGNLVPRWKGGLAPSAR